MVGKAFVAAPGFSGVSLEGGLAPDKPIAWGYFGELSPTSDTQPLLIRQKSF